MLRLLLLVTGALILCTNSYGIRFDRYHNYAYIQNYLKQVASDNDHVSYHSLGQSTLGREIAYLEITKTPKDLESPALYVNGTHHGNERASTEASLGVIDFLSRKHNLWAVDKLLKRYRIIVQPVVNPDGFVVESRFAADGTDPNRDYPHPTNLGKPFQLKETQLVSQLMQSNRFVGSVAFHSGIEAILWPWCFSDQKVHHEREFFILGKVVAQAMGIGKYKQSYTDYKSEGEFIDYAYMTYGTYALTVEVSPLTKPPVYRLPSVVKRAVKGFLAFTKGLEKINEKQAH